MSISNRKTLIIFLLITFSLTWGLAAVLVFFTDDVVAIFGEVSASNPLFILAVYSPGITAIILVWRNYGVEGLFSFLRRLTMWRINMEWWHFLIIGIPLTFYLGAFLKGAISDPFPFETFSEALPVLILALFLGPVEEFGWRGLALPLLQRRLLPFWAGLLLGVIWAIWHIPAFLMSGAPQSGWSFTAFFFGVVAISIILTAMFNDSKGSLLIAYLYHFQMMNPIWPDAQPYDTYIFLVIAACIVWLKRASMFSTDQAVTEVLKR